MKSLNGFGMRVLRLIGFCLCFLGVVIPMSGQSSSHWNCDITAYQYDMTLYLQLEENGIVFDDYSDYEVAGFDGNDCRGSSTILDLTENDGSKRSILRLRLRSNTVIGDTLQVKIYQPSKKKERTISTWIVFKSTLAMGTPSDPIILSLGNTSEIYITDKCRVTFMADGNVVKEETLDYRTVISVPEAPDKEGYTFTSWGDVDAVVPPHDVTYTAIYTVNQYKVTFMADGKVVKAQTLDYGTTITAPTAPTKEGYTFSSWGDVDTTVPAHDVTYTAAYTVNQYKVTFMADGKVVKEQTLDYGTTITVPTAPTKEGYTFSSWGNVDKTVPAHDVTYTAAYTVNQYKVTFVADGKVVKEQTLDYGTTITAPTAPTKEGYTFSSWGDVDKTVPAHDVVYTAAYTVNQYKVTFIADGIVVQETMLDFGADITIPEAPVKEGYTFMTWGDVDATVPSNDVTYTAEYVKNRLKGDVNEDGKVDISDVVALINHMAGMANYRYADVNEDTKVNISDVVAVINIMAGKQ